MFRTSELVLLKVAATEDGRTLPHSGRPFLPEGSADSGGSVAQEPGELVFYAGFLSGSVTACSEPPGLGPDIQHLLQG